MTITPSLISLGFTILFIIIILLSFLRGLIRGRFKSIYRFVISTIIIGGSWLLLPLLTKTLMDYDFSKLFNFNINGTSITSVTQAIEVITKNTLGIVEGSEIVIKDTLFYGFAYATIELAMRVCLLIVIIVLNFTIIRWIFWLIYLGIKPKKKEKKQNKHRLSGGIISAINGLVICLMIFIPLSGVYDIANNAYYLINASEESEVKVALGSEIIIGGNEFDLGEIKEYMDTYRKSVPGTIFNIKIKGTPIDCILFDSIFNVKYNNEKIKLRKEIATVSSAFGNLQDVITKVVNNEFVIEDLDNISKEQIVNTFDQLSKLEIINIACPIAFETGKIIIQNNEEMQVKYAKVIDIINNLNPEELDISGAIADVGNVFGALIDLADSSGLKISDIASGKSGEAILKAIINADETKVSAVFDSISSIRIIDTLQDIAFSSLESLIENTDALNNLLILYPKLEVIDGVLYVDGNQTTINPSSDYQIMITENKTWEINGIDTLIDATNNIFKLNLEDVKITEEIKNFGNVYESFRKLNITDVSQIQEFITNGPSASGSINLSLFTYENINALISSILNFKLIANNQQNIYAIINNMLPYEYRGLISKLEFRSEDITSLIYACKIVAETNVIWDKDIFGETVNYEKLEKVFYSIKDDLAKYITDSSLVTENISSVANYALKVFFPTLQMNFDCVNWETEGEAELKKLFNVLDEVLKYGDKLTKGLADLTDDDIKEISQMLKDNMASSILLRTNMNNIFASLTGLEAVKNSGVVLVTIEDDGWTTEELENIFDSLRALASVMKKEEGVEKNLFVELLNIAKDNVDLFLSSKFIEKNIVYNFVSMTKEGGILENKITVSLSEESEMWYDHYDGQTMVKGELRKVLESAFMLLEGVTNIEDSTLFIQTIIENLNKYKDTEDIKTILESKILSETLIYYIENLDTVLGSGVSDLIVVSDDINYYDTKEKGELRKIIEAICALLVDDEGKCDLSRLTSGDQTKLLEILINTSEEKIDTILSSTIIIDSVSKALKEFNVEDAALTIFVPEKDRTRDDWRKEIKNMIVASKAVLIDENGNIIDLNSSEEEYIKIISRLDKEEIDAISESEIITCTIANLFTNLATLENSVIALGDDYKLTKDNYIELKKQKWQEELPRLIEAISELLFDNDGNSRYNAFISGNTNELLSIICEANIDVVTNSHIIVDTVSIQIMRFDDSVIVISDRVKAYNREEWREEIKDICFAASKILVDEKGNINVDKLSSDVDLVLNNLCKLNNEFNSQTDEIGRVLSSNIISDTIISYIEKAGADDGFLVISKDISWKDTNTKEGELRLLLKSIKILFSGNISISEINVDRVLNLTETEIEEILLSRVLNDTISDVVYEAITSSALNEFIVFTGQTREEKIAEVSSDNKNLIVILQRLNECGVEYDNFSYEGIESYICGAQTEEEQTKRADYLADTFALSNIIRNSTGHLVEKLFSYTLRDDQMQYINTNMEINGENYWFDKGERIGEFKKLFRIIACISQFTSLDSSNINSAITDSEKLSKPLLLINDSLVLNGMIHVLVEDALQNVGSWKYQVGDPLYKEELSKEEWDSEIIVICNVIALVNQEESFDNLGNLNVKDDNLEIESFKKLLKEIAKSRLLDISNIETFVEEAVKLTFNVNVEVGNVYSGNDYDEKVRRWNTANTGEIDLIINACKKLRNIKDVDITNKNVSSQTISYDGKTLNKVGQINAYHIGEFLDSCMYSAILKPVVNEIFDSICGGYMSSETVLDIYGSFTKAMVSLYDMMAILG